MLRHRQGLLAPALIPELRLLLLTHVHLQASRFVSGQPQLDFAHSVGSYTLSRVSYANLPVQTRRAYIEQVERNRSRKSYVINKGIRLAEWKHPDRIVSLGIRRSHPKAREGNSMMIG